MTRAEFTRMHDAPLYLRAVAGWRYAALYPLPSCPVVRDPEALRRDAFAAVFCAGCEEN